MVKVNKLVVVGLKGIGKTSLIEHMIYGNLGKQDLTPTIEDIYTANVLTDRGSKEHLRIYDIEGFGSDKSDIIIPKHFHSVADAFVLIYSAESRISFEVIEFLKRDIEKNREKQAPMIIVIRMSPRSIDKPCQVDEAFAGGWATREKVFHFNVNLTDRRSLFQPFMFLASKLNPPLAPKTFAPLGMSSKKAVKE